MKTLVNFILDKSGSMASVKQSTINGFNEYIQTLKRDENSEYEFSLTLFDTEISRREALPLRDVKELDADSYSPNGGTALYDAVCRTISGTRERADQKVITIIMTDGEENASVEYNKDAMKTLIKDRESKGNWSFVYLGANQDSYTTAKSYGINAMNTVNFNSTNTGVKAAMETVSRGTMFYAQSAGTSTNSFFSSKDQSDLEGTK